MSDGSIAIVGASCRFPGADGLAPFWQLLTTGTDAVSVVDPQRWSTRFYHHPSRTEPGKSYTWAAGLIDGVDLFDPAFFGISPREAAQMDPQQRLLLELVWHALEDAGIPAGQLAGTATGVYIGGSSTDYSDLRICDPAGGDSYFMTGNTLSILANRVSYVFDLRGPSLTVDTACSSSLVALHHACEAIRDGRIGGAIVGGINLLLAPYPFLGFCRASMLSRRGRCFAFDARADGYVRGEGGGIIVLKPLAAALADGDPIRAVIRGTGVNSDGRTIGLSLPSEAAQASLLRAVYAEAGVAPGDLAFFEMHGTGTPAGDPIEAAAVGNALGQGRGRALPIGSVKTNIGHLEPASGMAGIIKAALALEHRLLPPTLNCETPNPNIPFDSLNLRLVATAEALPASGPCCAGVNSFGFGGTNAHVVLAAAPPRAEETARKPAPLPPLVISARSAAGLRAQAESWGETLARTPRARAPALFRTAARRRDHHSHRLVAFGREPTETAAALASFLADPASQAIVSGTAVASAAGSPARLAFVFAGNGAQWVGMARNAYHANAAFRAAIAAVDAALWPALGASAGAMIAEGVEAGRLARADIAQPLLFAIQVGIVEVLRGHGIVASAHLGHSVGEIAAAWAAGALSLAEAARVVIVRSRNQQRTAGTGRMAALAAGDDAAAELLAELGSPLELAALNAREAVTVSGPSAAIDALGAEARRRGMAFRALDLDFAFHSAAMDPIRAELIEDLSGLASRAPRELLMSSVTGEAVAAGALDAEYWWRNIRSPVRFAEGAARLIEAGCRIFVEIGPNPVLQAYLHDALRAHAGEGEGEAPGRVLASLSRRQDEADPFPQIAARAHVAGHDPTRSAGFEGPQADPRLLPLHRWQRERFWFEKTAEAVDATNPPFEHPLLGFRQPGPVPFWLNHLDEEVLPWIADHAIEGMAILPAAAVVEMALASARARRPEARALELLDVELRRPLPFDKGRMRELKTTLGSDEVDWELASRPRLSAETATVHAVARLSQAAERHKGERHKGERHKGERHKGERHKAPGRVDPSGAGGTFGGREIAAATLYGLADRLGLNYGARFRTVERIELFGEAGAADSAVVWLDAAAIGETLDSYLIHPALLDGALQGFLALLADGRSTLGGVTFVPWRFGRVRLPGPFGRVPRSALLRLTRIGTRSASADITLLDAAGETVAEIAECWFRRVELTRRGAVDERVLRVDLVPAPIAAPEAPAALDRVGDWVGRHVAPGLADPAGSEQILLVEALSAAIAVEALQAAAGDAESFTIDGLVEAGRVAPEAEPLVEALLLLALRFGAAQREGRAWRLVRENELPAAPELWRLLLADRPQLVGELALLAAAAAELPDVLARGLGPEQASAPAMVDHLLQAAPAGAAGIELLCDMLAEIAAEWPADRPLRIVELGAGGGATRRLIERLTRSGIAFTYRATDPDPEQAARLAFLVAPFLGATAERWSPREAAPAARDEAAAEERFDIVVAANACARLQLDAAALSRLRERLVPGGLVLAVEPEPNPLWDIVFGRQAAWWQDANGSPLRTGEEWRAELALAGFPAPRTLAAPTAPWPSAVLWARAPGNSADTDRDGTAAASLALTLVSSSAASAGLLGEALTAAGHRVAIAQDAVPTAGAVPNSETPEVILVLVEAACGEDPVAAAAAQIAALARTAAACVEQHATLCVVTCGAQQGNADDAGAASAILGAALWGFARTLLNEMPRLALKLVDLDPGATESEHAQAIVRELAAHTVEGGETEIAWTASGRHVLRLRRGLPPRFAAAADPLVLASLQPGSLDALCWQPGTARAPGANEVAIDVAAAGLNFRDVMWAMGLLPEEALIDGFAGPTFGLECAGTVCAVGAEVDDLAVGDRVAGFAPAALATRVTTEAGAVIRLPAETSFAAAATVPVTFVTAIYALGTLGRLAAGEHVLIHAAAGGVGLAAIQYAKHRGAIVIATAGSPIKRAFLHLAGADHVLDSRDFGFGDAVRALTKGAGVDIVLNSLSGEAMEQSLDLLKPFGRFLELGKRDFYLNRRLHMRPLRQNISYFAIDVDQLPTRRPELARELLGEVSAALAAGAIRPLAHRVFAFAEIDEAFRLMQASGHIGKLVLIPGDRRGVALRAVPPMALAADGAYLVTGGLSGFGFAAARWLVAQGARSLALLGRRGLETEGAAERVAALRAQGVEVSVHAADVADPAALAAVLDSIRAAGRPLRGILHAASGPGDGLASEIDGARVETALRAKLGGALLLDRLTRDDPVELFLLFSSATTLLGAPGQGMYVAANLALEALARRRLAAGKPALAVAWGPIEDAGYLAERAGTREALARRLGAKPIEAAHALAALPALLASGLATAGIVETSWHEARRYLPILTAPLFAEIRAEAAASPSDESLAERLALLSGEEAQALLRTVIAEEAATILRLPASSIDPVRPLSEIGMDSLMAVELRLALESRLRVDLPLMSLAEGTSVASIAGRLSGAVASRPQDGALVDLAQRYGSAEEARIFEEADAALKPEAAQ